jgi:hypothetical protein
MNQRGGRKEGEEEEEEQKVQGPQSEASHVFIF